MPRQFPPRIVAIGLVLGGAWLTRVPTALAIQPHGEPEGYVAHQLAHAFFLLALVYMLVRFYRDGRLRQRGWADVGLAIAFFAAWNVLTIVSHGITMGAEPGLVGPYDLSVSTTVDVSTPTAWMAYIGNLDYLLAVPGMAMLYRGFRRLTPESMDVNGETG